MNIIRKASRLMTMPSKAVSFSTLKIVATTTSLSIGNIRNKNINININNNINNNNKERRRMYSLAIARQVPRSLPDAITVSSSNSNIIDYNRATLEHDNYLKALRKYIPVLCLPPLDNLPDSMFVEDTVVTVGHKAVITNPGHPSRRREVDTIRTLLEDQLAMDVTDMREDPSATATTAYCDGGDVMFTGRHLFVGISGERTSFEAIKILEKGLDVEVIPIPFQQGTNTLHLKSIITHVDEHTLLVPDNNDLGNYILQTMMEESNSKYDIVRLPSHATLSCNVVSVKSKGRGGLLAQLSHEDDHRTRSILKEISHERDLRLEFVSLKEAAKCDGALTCCSVLLDL